jgi:hypothetical protein
VPVEVDLRTFHVMRRLVRGYLVAQARRDLAKAYTPHLRQTARRRLVYTRRMLRWTKRDVSKVRGIGHWVDETVQQELLAAAWALTSRPAPSSQRMALGEWLRPCWAAEG